MLLSELVSALKGSQMIAIYMPWDYDNPFIYTKACLIPAETAGEHTVNELSARVQLLPDCTTTDIVLHVKLA